MMRKMKNSKELKIIYLKKVNSYYGELWHECLTKPYKFQNISLNCCFNGVKGMLKAIIYPKTTKINFIFLDHMFL